MKKQEDYYELEKYNPEKFVTSNSFVKEKRN